MKTINKAPLFLTQPNAKGQHVILFLKWIPGGTVLHFPAEEEQEPDDGLVTELQT